MKSRLRVTTFFCVLFLTVEVAPAQTWTQTTATNMEWTAIASSADGTKLAAAALADASGTGPGGIFASTNSGNSWTERLSGGWWGIASSADGSRLVAVVNNAIAISTDSGATWTNISAPSGDWRSVASSADGSKLVTISYISGSVYVSTNSGSTWRFATNTGTYGFEAACSADGTKMAVVGHSTPRWLFTSTNTGVTWQLSFSNAMDEITGMASSGDGGKLFVYNYDPYSPTNLYTSTNWGATWSSNVIVVPPQGGSLASSADGSRLVMVGNADGSLYTSADSGTTWISNNAPNETWESVASSADGHKSVAVVLYGGIWTLQTTPTRQLNISASDTNLKLSWLVPSTNFVLQQNLNLTATNWLTLTNTPKLNLSNLNDEVILSPSNNSGFFRLMAQ